MKLLNMLTRVIQHLERYDYFCYTMPFKSKSSFECVYGEILVSESI